MKKSLLILSIILVLIILFFIPIKSKRMWINDSDISDIGHYEEYYFNIYNMKLYKK